MNPFTRMTFGTIVVAGALHMPFDAAFAKKAKPAAAKPVATKVVAAAAAATTDVAECGKLPAESRDRCISVSRPVTGAALYTQYKADAATVAAATAAAAKARAARFAKGGRTVAVAKTKPTSIAECAKAAPAQRDRCISLSMPVTGPGFEAKPSKTAAIATGAAVAAAPAVAAVKAVVAPVSRATTRPDGTTDIAECAKLAAASRDRCISLSRPVKGADLMPKPQIAPNKVTAAAATVAAPEKAKAAPAKPTAELKSVLRRDGTTDLSDCAKVSAAQRDTCLSRSRPVKGPVSITRT